MQRIIPYTLFPMTLECAAPRSNTGRKIAGAQAQQLTSGIIGQEDEPFVVTTKDLLPPALVSGELVDVLS